MIPPQLQKEGFRFIRVRPKDKRPQDNAWQTGNNFSYDSPELKKHLSCGGNFGVATGYEGLLGVDFDSREFEEAILPQLPRTFQVLTGSGGRHCYFLTDDTKSTKITSSDGKTLADIQGDGKQLIGPGSTHPNGKKYAVLLDAPIAYIERSRLDAILGIAEEKKKISKLQRCPYHDDKNASLATYDDGSFYCFGCNASGTTEALEKPEKAKSQPNKQGGKHHYIPTIIQTNTAKNQHTRIETDAKNFIEKIGLARDHQEVDYLWEKGRYKRINKTKIHELISQEWSISTLLNARELEGYKRMLQVLSYQRFKELDPQKQKISFQNKGIDFEKGVEITPTKNTFYLNSISRTISGETETPTIDKMFKDWVGEQKYLLLKDLIAYCCLPKNPLKLIIFLFGPHNSGKSTYNKIVERFLGQYNTHASKYSLVADGKQRFENVNFRGKLAVFLSEVEGETAYETTNLKQLSGGDLIRGELKGIQDPINFYFYGLVLISCNDIPQIKNESDTAFQGRAAIIDFPTSFTPKSIPIEDTIPEQEYNNLATWCYQRLKEWSIDGITIRGLPEWKDRVADYTQRTNPIRSFCEEYIEFDSEEEPENSEYSILCKDFNDQFNEYMLFKGKKPLDAKQIGLKLSNTYKDQYKRMSSSITYTNSEGKTMQYREYRGMRAKINRLNRENRGVGIQTPPVKDETQTTGLVGLDGLLLKKLSYNVYHKCKYCDFSPCTFQSTEGFYVCELCATKGDIK